MLNSQLVVYWDVPGLAAGLPLSWARKHRYVVSIRHEIVPFVANQPRVTRPNPSAALNPHPHRPHNASPKCTFARAETAPSARRERRECWLALCKTNEKRVTKTSSAKCLRPITNHSRCAFSQSTAINHGDRQADHWGAFPQVT